MDYLKTLKKYEKERVQKKAIYKKAEKPFQVNNPEYDAEIEKLLTIDNLINLKTKSTDARPLLLLDQMRLKILAKNFEKTASNIQSWDSWLLEMAGFDKYTYCGSGTNILERTELDKDFNNNYVINSICKNHDIAYSHARTHEDIKQADYQMIKEIVDNYFVSNLFGTREKIHAFENIQKNIFSLETGYNLMKVYGLYTIARDVLKTPYDYYKTQQQYEEQSALSRQFSNLYGQEEKVADAVLQLDVLNLEQEKSKLEEWKQELTSEQQKITQDRLELETRLEQLKELEDNLKRMIEQQEN